MYSILKYVIKDGMMVETKKKIDFNINTEEMARAGLHLGHKTSKTHPKMKNYIYGVKNTVHLIDLEKTKEKLEEALRFIQGLMEENKTILFVGTKVQARDLVKNTAMECDLPYVVNRWLGGIFTNFEVIKKRVESFKDLEKKRASGELDKYTKKERANFDRKINDLEMKFGGIKNMNQLPDAIFALDMRKDLLAIKEAKIKGVKIVAMADTDADPNSVDYPIPANDDAVPSIKYILEKVKEAVLKTKNKKVEDKVEDKK